LLLVKN